MSSVLDQRERETLKVVRGSLGMVLLYHGWFREGFGPLPVIYRKVSEEIRSNRSIYEKSEIDRKGPKGYGRLWKILASIGTTQAVLGSPEGSIIGVSTLP
jgi:hypothetical protein